MPDPNQIGQDRQYPDASDAYDADKGKHADNTSNIPEVERFQESEMPKGADPSPFKLGPLGAGGR